VKRNEPSSSAKSPLPLPNDMVAKATGYLLSLSIS